MPACSVSKRINAPADRVFAVMTDLEGTVNHIDSITKLEIIKGTNPAQVGTRFRETRKMFGQEATEEMEVTALEPNRSMTVECKNHGAHYKTVFTLTPVPEGTDINMNFDCRPLSLFAKLFSPLAGMMMGPMKKALTNDLDGIKKAAESAPA